MTIFSMNKPPLRMKSFTKRNRFSFSFSIGFQRSDFSVKAFACKRVFCKKKKCKETFTKEIA
jgi:hypothetical protein